MSDRIVRLNPAGLHATPGYHHVTVVEAGRTAYLAGQCPLDGAGDVPEGLDAQVDLVVTKSLRVLRAIAAGAADVVKSVVYVVSPDQAILAGVWDRFTGSVLGPAFTTASTLLGVAQLGYKGQLVELDLIVALPA